MEKKNTITSQSEQRKMFNEVLDFVTEWIEKVFCIYKLETFEAMKQSDKVTISDFNLLDSAYTHIALELSYAIDRSDKDNQKLENQIDELTKKLFELKNLIINF